MIDGYALCRVEMRHIDTNGFVSMTYIFSNGQSMKGLEFPEIVSASAYLHLLATSRLGQAAMEFHGPSWAPVCWCFRGLKLFLFFFFISGGGGGAKI